MKLKKYVSNTIFLLIFITAFYSCSPTKYVPKNKYIVDKVKIKIEGKKKPEKIKISKLNNITQTVGLKKVLGIIALRARFYNIPNPLRDGKRNLNKKRKINKINARKDAKFDKETEKLRDKRNRYFNKQNRLKKQGKIKAYKKAHAKYLELNKKYEFRTIHSPELKNELHKSDIFTFSDFFRKIGQKPQIFDTFYVNMTLKQYSIYLKNKGYFKPKLKVEIDTIGKKKVKIIYKINPGPPLKIGSISYNFPKNQKIIDLFVAQKLRLKVGKIIDIDELENFRSKIADYYRNKGYYYFSSQLITYKIDTIGKYNNASLIVEFKKDVNPKIYQPWYIKNIYILTDYQPNEALQNPKKYFRNIDTIPFYNEQGNKYFIMKKHKIVIKPKYLLKEIYLKPDSLYSLKLTQDTYSHLSKFKIYKLTNIQFSEDSLNKNKNYLNCDIFLSPDKTTDVIYEIEATNTSLNNGGAANISFSHRNLFHGGENLNMKIELALQKQKTKDSTEANIFNTQEYSFDIKLTFPRLLIPFKKSIFVRQNNPQTIITTKFGYQNRPEFNKIEAILNFDYLMKSSEYSNFVITPMRFSSVRVLYIAPDFEEYIKQSSIQESYEDHFIFGSKFTYTYSNQGKPGNNFFLQTNFSIAGNSLYALMKSIGADTINGAYNFPLFNTPFAQFIKADFDLRYYIHGFEDQRLVLRLFAGAGIPFGNSKQMPFGEKYFSGGANSIRGWQARTLGPGSSPQPKNFKYINQTGDIKLETNIEYRFPIISILEGALFIDIGNIWDVASDDKNEDAIFRFDKFYRQLAYSTGFGLRLNSSYFVFRTDLGIKLADPSLPQGHRFIPFERKYNWQDFVINIAIGYPF
jgi:outer membrane protein assembly factor BamA